MNKLGRRISLVSSLLTCGVTCILGAFIPEKVFWIQTILFLVGKMAITSSFAISYVYSGKYAILNQRKVGCRDFAGVCIRLFSKP